MPSSYCPQTLIDLFAQRCAQDAAETVFFRARGEDLEPLTWADLRADVLRTASALRALGIGPGDRVVQASENRYEWIVCDLAIHVCRAVHVAVHAVLAGPQIAEQICDSGARVVILSTPAQSAKLAAAGPLPSVRAYLSHEPIDQPIGGQRVERLDDLKSEAATAGGERLLAEAQRATRPADLATILYTSGTTGEPKGVMLSHANLVSNALAKAEVFELQRSDLRLCWLPLSHVYARTCDYYTWLAVGYQLALARSRETVLDDCSRVRPTVMSGVPYFYHKVYRLLRDTGRDAEPGALQSLLGGRLRLCGSGGAALPDEVARFFFHQGVPLLEGYGLTETSPVITSSSPSSPRIGTVGRPLTGVEVRIAADGEVLTRGPHVMLGYWNQPEATAATICDGWLQTGDLGELDKDGYLRITGRKKELIVTAAGKNVAPAYLESLLTQDPLIAQAIIVGENRNYLAALVVPEFGELEAVLLDRGVPARPQHLLLNSPEVQEIFSERIKLCLAGVSKYEQVQRFALLEHPFSVERDELTPTLKLRRNTIAHHYAELIDTLYEQPVECR